MATLRKIVIFRKLGMTLSDIEKIFSGKCLLSESVEQNILKLKEKIEELNSALKVCELMKKNCEELDRFDEIYYWKVLYKEEEQGNHFMSIAQDVLQYEKKVVFKQFGIDSYDGRLQYGKLESFLRAVGLALAIGIFNYFLNGRTMEGFLFGFFMPVSWIVIETIFGLPLHFLGKKHPRLAKNIRKTGISIAIICVVILLLIAFFV